jgi:hypothetical protein
MMRNSGKPELRRNPSAFAKVFTKKMDARVISAFTRVFDALPPAHDEAGSRNRRADAQGIS